MMEKASKELTGKQVSREDLVQHAWALSEAGVFSAAEFEQLIEKILKKYGGSKEELLKQVKKS